MILTAMSGFMTGRNKLDSRKMVKLETLLSQECNHF